MSNIEQKSAAVNTLETLGLGQNEAILYEILVKNPGATIPGLRQMTSFSRPMLYYILKSLGEYELVEEKKTGKKTSYFPAPPDKLLDLLKEQEKELEQQKTALSEVVSDLGSAYRLATGKPGVRFFEGLAGVREVTFDSLKAQGEILTFLDVEATQKYIMDINKEYVAERVKRNISKRQIAPDTPFTRERYKKYSPLLEVRLVPPELKPFKTSVQIYNNTVSFSSLTDKKMIGIIIEDEHIAQLHRSLFEYIWGTLKSLPRPINPTPLASTPPLPPPVLPAESS